MKRFLYFVLTVVATLCASPQFATAKGVAPLELARAASAVPDSCVVPSTVVSIRPSIRYASVTRSAFEPSVSRPTRAPATPLELIGPLGLLLFAGAIKTTAADKDSKFTTDTVRAQLNKLVASFNYFLNNGVMSTTVATQPVVATATVTSKVKTTNATVLKESGIAVALAGSDNFWTLTGANIAAGFFRRYLLLDTAGVASVLASSDAATKAGCLWPSIPADGTAIVGILTIQNATNPFIPGTTLLGAAGVTATYQDGIDDSVFLHAQVTP